MSIVRKLIEFVIGSEKSSEKAYYHAYKVGRVGKTIKFANYIISDIERVNRDVTGNVNFTVSSDVRELVYNMVEDYFSTIESNVRVGKYRDAVNKIFEFSRELYIKLYGKIPYIDFSMCETYAAVFTHLIALQYPAFGDYVVKEVLGLGISYEELKKMNPEGYVIARKLIEE